MASELFKIRKWRIYINYFGILFGKYNIFNIKYQYSLRMYKSVCMGFSSFTFLQMGTIVATIKGGFNWWIYSCIFQLQHPLLWTCAIVVIIRAKTQQRIQQTKNSGFQHEPCKFILFFFQIHFIQIDIYPIFSESK